MHGMTADLGAGANEPPLRDAIDDVRSADDLDAWHRVYCEVLGSDPRGRDDWRRVHDALGPAGDGSLVLLLARVDGAAAATGGVFFAEDAAGLYCFATREAMRGRGLASAPVQAAHALARRRRIMRALLQATLGRQIRLRARLVSRRAADAGPALRSSRLTLPPSPGEVTNGRGSPRSAG
jgi:GNAT superfamily N-acetyltransferase